MNINSAQEASKIITKLLRDLGLEIEKSLTHFNPNGKHVELRNQRTGKIYHVKYCKEPFYKFGYFFRQHHGKIGETLDIEILDNLSDDDDIFISYPDKIYRISAGDFKENGLTRTNDSDNNKQTLSIPIDLLERFY